MPKSEYICPGCRSKLSAIREPTCLKCGKPVLTQEQEYCFDCVKRKHTYRRGFCVFLYEDRMKQAVGDFKFRNRKELGAFFAEEMVRTFGQQIRNLHLDAMIPIPIHPSKKRFRGYNQAEVLCDELHKRIEIPVIQNLLIRNKKTVPQKKLNDTERLRNLEAAFGVDILTRNELIRSEIKVRKVLLVDDIYTTGSTIEACTAILHCCGIDEVYFLCICIGQGL